MSDPVSLPRPTPEDEDRFIQGLTGQDTDRVADAVRAALSAGRPALASRAVGLLGDAGAGDPELDRARKAARFLLMQGGPSMQVDVAQQLDMIVARLRSQRMKRARRRQRDKLRRHPRDPTKRRPRD